MDETEIGGSDPTFHPTLWTEVLRARDPASPERRKALERLIEAYWKPLYFYLRRKGTEVEAAKDLIQSFFTAFLERDFLRYVDRARGKFRTFLLTALDHFVADEYRKEGAQKRGGGRVLLSLDFASAETEVSFDPASREDPERFFLREWAKRVIERGLERLERRYREEGRGEELEAFRSSLSAGEAPSYAELAERLGITVNDVKNRLHRARLGFREALRAEVRSYTDSDPDAEEELRDLFSAFL